MVLDVGSMSVHWSDLFNCVGCILMLGSTDFVAGTKVVYLEDHPRYRK